MGDAGIEILWNVYEISESSGAEEIFNSAYEDEAEIGQHNFNLSTLVCLPKEPTGEDPQMGAYFAPKATRPLSIVNCDNRLIASAMRSRWESQFKLFIRERQQGFLKNRSMIRNLLEVDTAMICAALTHEDSATIFLDFEAAFPSITQEYTFEALSSCGVPEEAMNSFKFFYRQSRCRIAVKGQTYDGFNLEAGVRQGCPLSPIVYAMVAEILLDRLEQQVEGIFVRAYADDTALIVQNIASAIPTLEKLFEEFERISGLRLNVSKSIIIPHNGKGESANRRALGAYAEKWSHMQIAYKAKYLGFILGPKKGESSWKKPVEKLRKRIELWQDMPAGLFWNCRIYNTFLFPVLLFIAQLEPPPQFAIAAADEVMLNMAKGPGNWCCKEDLWSLNENFGQSCSFNCLEWAGQAAKMRVLLKDKGISSHSEFLMDVDTLERNWRESNRAANAFMLEWKKRSFVSCLIQNNDYIEENIGSHDAIRRSRPHSKAREEDDKSWQREIQSTYYKCIQALHLKDPINRVRQKLQRYELRDERRHCHIPGSVKQRTPAWQARRTHRNLRNMKQISPPRVQGAVLSTIWNRWTTEARMQQTRRQRCLLCRAEDSRDAIEHYATCPMTRRLMSARLNMEPDVFANLHSWTLCSPCIRTEEQLLCIGIAIYAVYNTTNKLRRAERLNCLSMEDRYQALAQSVKEAVRGHHKAVATLSQRWTRSREEQPLSFSFEVWDMDVASKKNVFGTTAQESSAAVSSEPVQHA